MTEDRRRRTKNFIKVYREYDIKAEYFFLGIIISLISFIILLGFIGHYAFRGSWDMDENVYNFLSRLRNDRMTSIVKIITAGGNLAPVLLITLGSMALFEYKKRRGEGLFFGGSVLGVWLFNALLKISFKRPRPEGLMLVEVNSYSFPSGHAMISMGLALIVSYFVLIYIKRRAIASAVTFLTLAYALLVGLSRVYLGVHYFSDIAAGWAAGALWSSASIMVYKIVGYRRYLRN